MRNKIHLKKKYHLKTKNKIAIIIFLIIFCLIFTIFNIGKKSSPIIMHYGEVEAEKLANIIISNAVSKDELSKFKIDELFIIKKDNNGDIQTIDFNSINVNRIIFDISTKIQTNLKYVEKGEIEKTGLSDEIINNYNYSLKGKGIIYEVPLGVVFNNPILANLGPKIPIKFTLMGNIVANLESSIKNYGINNALFEVKMKLDLSEKLILPFKSEKIKITSELPIALKLIQGTVPSYYLNNKTNSDPITIPIQ